MQLHSSIVPAGFIAGLTLGSLTYSCCHGLGAAPSDALAIAKFVGVTTNVVVGGAKNVLLADFLSLLLVRPLSAVGTMWAVAAMAVS